MDQLASEIYAVPDLDKDQFGYHHKVDLFSYKYCPFVVLSVK
jgi:hypothetical protein